MLTPAISSGAVASARLVTVTVCAAPVVPTLVDGKFRLDGDTFISGVIVAVVATTVRSMLPEPVQVI